MGYEHIEIESRDGVGWLWLNRPEKRNALSADMWADIPEAVEELSDDTEVRAIVVAGRGTAFTVGIDLEMLASMSPGDGSPAVQSQQIYHDIKRLQETMSSFERCPQPTIAAVHGYCLGAGIDLITACDIRVASADAVFSVRETRLALVADVGTLQRLPRIIAPGHAAELAYTGRDIDAAEAERIGLVNRVHPESGELHRAAESLAREIASNSPLVVQGTKAVLRARSEMSIDQALDHVALWNAAFLRSNDLAEALAAYAEKRSPRFDGS